MFLTVKLTSCSIIFVHGLEGHPRYTWENSPSVEGGGLGDSAPEVVNPKSVSLYDIPGTLNEKPVRTFWPTEYLPSQIQEADIYVWVRARQCQWALHIRPSE